MTKETEQVSLTRLEQVIKRLKDKNRAIRNNGEQNTNKLLFRFCLGYEEALKDIATFFELDLKDKEDNP